MEPFISHLQRHALYKKLGLLSLGSEEDLLPKPKTLSRAIGPEVLEAWIDSAGGRGQTVDLEALASEMGLYTFERPGLAPGHAFLGAFEDARGVHMAICLDPRGLFLQRRLSQASVLALFACSRVADFKPQARLMAELAQQSVEYGLNLVLPPRALEHMLQEGSSLDVMARRLRATPKLVSRRIEELGLLA